MSDDEEVIPPDRGALPANREQTNTSLVSVQSTSRPDGPVSSLITGFRARSQARAYRDIADNIRAQTEALDAETARRESTKKLIRKAGELEELPQILELDSEVRANERAEARLEMKHQSSLRTEQREEELAEARRKKLQAQNYEHYVKETKEINTRIGVALKLADEAQIKGSMESKPERAGARDVLAVEYERAIADGDHTHAARIKDALDALDGIEK
jgi:hypothetical protein